MKKIVFTSLVTVAFILTGANSGRSQNASEPKNGFQQPDLILKDNNTLNTDRCKSDFKLCADVMESAKLIGITYENESKIKSQLMQLGSGWDKGYEKKHVKLYSKSSKVDGVPVEAQAIFANKEINEGGTIKKKFLLSIRGTEFLKGEDRDTDLAALGNPQNYEGTKVANGFKQYADVIIQSEDFKNMINEVKKTKQKYEILVTGHSLGGAAAAIIKAEIEKQVPDAKDNISA